MEYPKNYIRWILPTTATIALTLLSMHRSDSPVLFNRYSVGYTVLLTLFALNLGFLWYSCAARVSYRQLIKRFSGRPLISVAILILSMAFLIDFIIGFPSNRSDLVNLVLLVGILIQAEGLRRESGQISGVLALLASSLVFTLILFELLLLSLVEPQTPKNQDEFIELMSSQWPQPISVAKSSGTFRILGLSDSYGTVGGVSANYHYVLEDLLQRNFSPEIQMMNVSVPAYEPRHQLRLLRFALQYSPDIVLHGFFVGNDFSLRDNNMFTFCGIHIYRELEAVRFRPFNFLLRGWIANAVTFLQEQRRLQWEQAHGVVDEATKYSKSTFLKVQFDRLNTWGKETDMDRERMKRIFAVLDAIRSAVEQKGARYVMVVHPDQTQVDEQIRREITRMFHVDENQYDYDLPSRMIRSYCADRSVLCLDLLPIFRAKARTERLYLPSDTHYNVRGNELAAITISRFLSDKQLVPHKDGPRNQEADEHK